MAERLGSEDCEQGRHYVCADRPCTCGCHKRFGKASDWPGHGPQLGSMGASHQAPPQDAA